MLAMSNQLNLSKKQFTPASAYENPAGEVPLFCAPMTGITAKVGYQSITSLAGFDLEQTIQIPKNKKGGRMHRLLLRW